MLPVFPDEISVQSYPILTMFPNLTSGSWVSTSSIQSSESFQLFLENAVLGVPNVLDLLSMLDCLGLG